MRSRFLPLVIVLLLASGALAQDGNNGPIRGNRSNARPDPRALGALGGEGIPATGEALRAARLRPPAVGVLITSLLSGGAGETGGLEVGDVIIGIGRKSLSGKTPPFLRLAELIEAPRKAGVPAIVKVRREGKTEQIGILVPGTTKHPKTCPEKCERCTAILHLALEKLASMQAEDGSLPTKLGGANGRTAVTVIAGLAFLASGSTPTEGPYSKNIQAARKWLVANAGHENDALTRSSGKNWSQVNWALGYAPLFLARVEALAPERATLTRLDEMRTDLIRNMEPTGGWAHGPRNDLPYPLGYAELTATGNICLAALGELKSLGLEVPDEVIVKAVNYIERSSDGGGGVGYSTRPGQQGLGSAGRSASALFAMSRLRLERHPFYKKLTSYLRRNLADIPDGHVSPDFHMFFASLACRVLGKRDWSTFVNQFRLEFLSLQNGDGTFGVRPADTSRFGMSNTDRTMGVAWRTATFAMILALPSGHLDLPAGELAR